MLGGLVLTLSIRTASTADLDTILDLYQYLHARDAPLPRAVAEETLKVITEDPRFDIFLGEVDGTMAVSCYLNIIPNLTRGGRPYGVIENVVTHPDYRRHGFGRAILHHALGAAWEAGCYKVMLMTGNPDNIAFYEAAGFEASAKHALLAKPD